MASIRSGGGRSWVVRVLVALFALAAVGAAAGALAIYVLLIRDLPDFRTLGDYRPPVVSEVFDREGRLVGEFYTQKRRIVPIDEIPRHVQLSFVAAEDGSFFEHEGIDYASIVRAAIANLRQGGIAQGASTITQQMVKSLLLSPERTYKRKLREMILARRIESQFSKDEILFLYLNQIYFGHGAWGIGQAARTYFGKAAQDLTVSEAALLAGLVQRPSAYDPLRNPEAAESRRRYVLGRMRADGYIDEATYQAQLAAPPELKTHPDEENIEASRYFTEEVRRHLFERLDPELVLNGGLRIETTLDVDLQRVAREAVRTGLVAHDRRRGYRGPLRQVAVDELGAELLRLGEATDPETGGLPFETPVEGIVLAVDAEAQTATVGFAPHLFAQIPLEEVEWARKADLDSRPRPVRRITEVFRVGDVAQFMRLGEPDSEPQPIPEPIPEPERQRLVSILDGILDGTSDRAIETGSDDTRDRTQRTQAPTPETMPEETMPPEAMPEEWSPRIVRVELWQEPLAEGALLSIDNTSGDVIALIGGYDFGRSEFDRAVQAARQPGSAFKPFIYGAALTRGFTPVSIVVDRPVVYTDPVSGFVWAPRNYGRRFYGPMTMRDALKKSINNATVHLFRDLGVRYVIDYARRLGIQSPLSADLSLALGSSSVTLLELTRAYAVYPRGGTRVIPRFIERVLDRDGQELLADAPLGPVPPPVLRPLLAEGEVGEESYPDSEILPTQQLISPADAYLMSDLLRAVVTEGTGQRLRRLGRTLAGKTGTTDNYTDAWFMGFSPELTTGVWVGHDDNQRLGWGETGARAALPIWGDFMKAALAPYPQQDFEVPENIEFQRVDRSSGLIADANTQDAYFQPFLAGTAPERSFSDQSTSEKSRQAAREDIF